jgi:hypothetical protein
MKILRFVRLTIEHAHNAWALREIHPAHPDTPRLVLRQRELTDALEALHA